MATNKKNKKSTKKPSAKKARTAKPSAKKPAAKKGSTKKPAEKKAAKKDEPRKAIEVSHKKKEWMRERDLRPDTGTRFRAGTTQQKAFDIVMTGANAGKTVTEIRAILAATRKENGSDCNMDSGYYNLVVACHPEFFQAFSDKTIEVLAEPEVDQEALDKADKEKDDRKKRQTKARGGKTTKKPARTKKPAGKPRGGRVVKKK